MLQNQIKTILLGSCIVEKYLLKIKDKSDFLLGRKPKKKKTQYKRIKLSQSATIVGFHYLNIMTLYFIKTT